MVTDFNQAPLGLSHHYTHTSLHWSETKVVVFIHLESLKRGSIHLECANAEIGRGFGGCQVYADKQDFGRQVVFVEV